MRAAGGVAGDSPRKLLKDKKGLNLPLSRQMIFSNWLWPSIGRVEALEGAVEALQAALDAEKVAREEAEKKLSDRIAALEGAPQTGGLSRTPIPVALTNIDTLEGSFDVQNTGGGQSHSNMQPFLTINYVIALTGIFPSTRRTLRQEGIYTTSNVRELLPGNPVLGGISMFAGSFPPNGFAFCNGQILPIQQNQALFALIGTTYGGDGTTTFALPDLRGRVPLHFGGGPGLSTRTMGEEGGSETTTLIENQLPPHDHDISPNAQSLAAYTTADLSVPLSSCTAGADDGIPCNRGDGSIGRCQNDGSCA